ncbi:MAG: hypothetical protein Q9216_001215 [Gyalolechia sp. 2 TL-2023]
MEKIRNLMNPGKSKDDEVMYGSGQSGDPVHTGSAPQATSSDPIASSTHPTTASTREPIGQGGTGSIQQGSTPLSSSRMPGTFDDDVGSTSSIKSGLPGNSHESKTTGIPETRDRLNTDKDLPREPAAGGTGAYSSSHPAPSGPHSFTSATKTDPRIDNELDRSRGLGSHGTTGNTSALSGSSLPDRTVGSTESTPGAGRSFPLDGTSSGIGNSGLHASNLANKADPRVDSDRDGSRGMGGSSGLGSGTGATVSSTHEGELSRSNVGGTTAASTGQTLPRGYGEETWTHDHDRHGHDYAGDPCENEPPAPGAVHFTSGPHSLDTANRLDPRVKGGDLEGTSSSITGGSVPNSGQRQVGGDVNMGAAVSTTPAGAYPGSRDVSSSNTTQHGKSTAGPHKSDLLNKVDPRVDSDLSKQREAPTMQDTTGVGSMPSVEPSTTQDHHHGRDAALVGAGAEATGAALHGGKQHHDSYVSDGSSSLGYSNPYPPGSAGTGLTSGPTSSTAGITDPTSQIPPRMTNTTGPTSMGTTGPTGQTPSGATTVKDPAATGKDHHVGRNAGLAGMGAGAAYETDKHLHGDTTRTREPGLSSQQPLSGTSVPEQGRVTGLSGAGTTGLHDSRHEPSSTSGPAGQPPTTYDDRSRAGGSHKGRDAALGAGVGAAAVAGGEELSRKDMERQQKADHKEQMKEQEAVHKQELKEQKHHQHEQEKAEKAHEKAIAKEEKHHQHEQEKAEKAHEKALAKEEAKHKHKDEPQEGEKKHHGLLGLFHRDKSDKEPREDETSRKEHLEAQSQSGVGTTGAAVVSEREKHERAKEHDRNRLHKDPPPGYGQPEYADPPKEGYASQVTGGTGTTALAQGEPVTQGSHMTGLGNKADPSIAERGNTIDSDRTRDDQGRLVEPHTSLPINTAKGDGAGGTDASAIPGYHPGQSHGTADKANGQGEGFGHFQEHSR